MIRHWIFRSGFLALILLLHGCATNVGSPVSEAGTRTDASGDTHRVQRGETLYSIAWRHGLDYQHLAKINKISRPYTIYVNQVIDLGTVLTTAGTTTAATAAPVARPPGGPKRAVRKKVVKQAPSTPQSRESNIVWGWPIEGEVVGQFSARGKINKGIDIHGKPGQTVATAADGVVVYAGGGLRGHGKLIIVKHNDHFLSAYGRNRRLLVKEGQAVRRGQKVAEVGIGTDQDTLHFEIRRDGKPENPLRHLPRR